MKIKYLLLAVFAYFFGLINISEACTSIPDKTGTVILGKIALKENYKCINTAYLEPVDGYGIHAGIDYKASKGTIVYAPVTGTVEYSKDDYGTVTIKDNQHKVYVISLHLDTRSVKKTDSVIAGVTQIGTVGGTGLGGKKDAFGPHLHIEVVSIGNKQGNSGVDRTWGRPYDDESKATIESQTIDPDTIYNFKAEFHGAGSLISPADTRYGGNFDFDAIHGNGKNALAVFQWYYTSEQCKHIDIALKDMEYPYPVKIRSGQWSNRANDSYYIAHLPVSIDASSNNSDYPWNVTAVTFYMPPQGTLEAKCSISSKVGNPVKITETQPESQGIVLDNDWIWNGNGSLISTINRKGYGTTKDVVNLAGNKAAAFFQWQKSSSCKNIQISSEVSGNYKLRLRGWNTSPTLTENRILARDVYVFNVPIDVLNAEELAKTSNEGYYLLSVFQDFPVNMSIQNPINVNCKE